MGVHQAPWPPSPSSKSKKYATASNPSSSHNPCYSSSKHLSKSAAMSTANTPTSSASSNTAASPLIPTTSSSATTWTGANNPLRSFVSSYATKSNTPPISFYYVVITSQRGSIASMAFMTSANEDIQLNCGRFLVMFLIVCLSVH